MLLKPRFGKRRCSGIWPPSNPFTATPVRAFWPFTPRPEVLPLPDPMPRPTRMRALREPGLSLNSLSFIVFSSSLVDNADEVTDLGDHTARCRRVRERLPPPDAVEAKAPQRLALLPRAALRARGLLDSDRLAVALLGHDAFLP